MERGKRTVTNGTLNRTMLSDDTVSLNVISKEVLDIRVNDYFNLFGEGYRINNPPEINKLNDSQYEYLIKAEGVMYDMLRCKFFNADGTGFKTELDFPLIGNLELFLTTIVNNMARFSDKWEVGTFDANSETKTLTFGSDTCLSALQKICQEFKTDFWIKTENGKFKIHTGNFGNTIPVTFEYGKGKGLYSLNRKNVNDNGIINRMYVLGGEQNLPNNYRNFAKNLKFSDDGYLEDTDLIATMGLKEGEMQFYDIYPHRTGTVTALGSTKFKFIDTTMDFDLNEKEADNKTTKYLKPDVTAKIHFNTGNLAGYEFEINKKGGYNHTTKEFTIIPITNDSGQKFPDENAEAFQIGVGDEYVLLDIYAPESYVTAAESELLTKAQEQFALKKQVQVSYDLNIDPEYLKTLENAINIGDYVTVKDTALGVEKSIRVNSISRNFIQNGEWKENDLKLTIADTYEISISSQLVLDIKEIININNIFGSGSINYSLIGLKTTRELQSLVFDTDGYFDTTNIRPNSIETNMITVGSQSQQLSCSVVFRVNADGFPNKIVSSAGKLFSQTFNKTWDIPPLTTVLPDSDYRYVYARCSKSGTAGNIFYSQAQIKFDEDPNDYYFLVGILHTVTEGMRVLSITIGTTTINGGLVRTGIISSLDGQTTFNLDTGEITGKITFLPGSSAFDQIGNSIIIGGKNLAKNSSGLIDSNAFWLRDFDLTENLENGKKYTATIWTKVPNQNPSSVFRLQNATGGIVADLAQIEATKYQATFTYSGSAINKLILFRFPDSGTWYQFDKFKIEKGTKSTDWTPSPEEMQDATTAAQNAANTANNLLSDIADDNKLTPSEKQDVKKEMDIINAEKPNIVNQAGLYNVSTVAYNQAYSALTVYITPLIVNLNVTSSIVGSTFRQNFANYYTAKVNLLKAITDTISVDFSEVYSEINGLRYDLLGEISDVNNQINNLDDYIKGAFSDGIISQAEAIAIEKYINQINTEKADVENKYNQIYNDSYLVGVHKSNLATAWGNYQTSHTNLINSINTAIADGITTPAEKADVDSKFLAYRNMVASITVAFQNALNAIEQAKINEVQIGGRNLALNSKGVIDSNSYWIRDFDLSEPLKTGEKYVVSVDTVVPNQNPSAVFVINDGVGNQIAVINSISSTKFQAFFTYSGAGASKLVFFKFPDDGTWYQFKQLKIERGTRATDWTPAPEDVDAGITNANQNSAIALAQAQNAATTAANAAAVTSFMQTTVNGNVVSTGTLLVGDVNGANAMISGVTDQPNGESIRFAAGKPYAQKYLSPFQVLDNGMVRFVNPVTGLKAFELGFNQQTQKVVFDIYNEDGLKIATIGSQGIVFTGYIPEKYTEVFFRKLTTNTFTQSAIISEMTTNVTTKIEQEFIDGYPPPYWQTWSAWWISPIGNYSCFLYNEGRNFESAENSQYAGYHPTANKFDEWIPDGIYITDIKQHYIVGTYEGQTKPKSMHYFADCYRIIDGVVVDMMLVSIPYTINTDSGGGGA